jgi:hypothetical protein
MTKEFIKAVPLPKRRKLISEMTDDEIAQYASDLVDGGLFSGVPGLSSDEAEAQSEEPTT